MKALAIRQPWAHAILHLGKRVENRDWSGCAYRGPVLLHASSKVVLRPTKRDPESFGDAVERILETLKPAPGADRTALLDPFAVLTPGGRANAREAHGEPTWRPSPLLPLGGIVGRARIVDAVRTTGGGHRVLAGPATTARTWRCLLCDEASARWLDEGPCPKVDPWAALGGFALVVADVEPLPFIPYNGKLGFFDVPDDLISQAVSQALAREIRGLAPC